MIADQFLLSDELSAIYGGGTNELDFTQVMAHFQVEDDAQLADLIEADGRLRLRVGKPVTLQRYLTAIPNLQSRADALDAAIDMALRAVARTGHADERSIRQLIATVSHLEPSIREAAALNNALWSTSHIQERLAKSHVKELPCGFGPRAENGVHRYELRELLGEGAFGQVYLAVDRQLSEADHPALVSIKLFPGNGRSDWSRQQLADEATKARRITHPNVARVLDRDVSDENQDFLVYEFVEGGDLGKWARRANKLDIGRTVQLIAKIARGVHAAHMAGLVHCDLKPNNIVLTADGEPKVADFGIAIRTKDHGDSRPLDEPPSEPRGNLAFMSPEQCRMEPGALTIPTDVYALGGILYWLLTGMLPNGSSPAEIRRAHDPVHGRCEPPLLRPHCPDADRDLEAICRRAMAPQPEQRYDSAAGFAEDLETWLRREPVAWTKPSILRRAALLARRKPTLAAATAVILTLLVAGGGLLQHLATVADQQRLETALAENRLTYERQYKAAAAAIMVDTYDSLGDKRGQGLEHEILPQIWVGEWILGPIVLGDGSDHFELWNLRVEVLRDLVAEARAGGGDRYFVTLLWKSALGFWLIHAGEYREAETLLADTYTTCHTILDPEDHWLVLLQAMRACAVVGRLDDADDGSEPPHGSPQELLALESKLTEAEQLLSADAPGSPLRLLVLEYLARLYTPHLLDRPQLKRDVEERHLDVSG